MTPRSLPALIESHLRLWRAQGLIDAEIEERLRAASLAAVEGRQSRKVLAALMTLGALFVLAGLILLVAENWEAIPPSVKLAAWAALQAGFLSGYLHAQNRGYGRVAETCALVAGGWVLAGIALVGQIYHLQSRPVNGVWLWAALLVPALWLLERATTTRMLFVGSLTLALWIETGDRESWLHQGYDTVFTVGYAVPLVAAAAGALVAWGGIGPLRGLLSAWLAVAGSMALLIIGWANHPSLDLFRLNLVSLGFVLAGHAAVAAFPRQLLTRAWQPLFGRFLAAAVAVPILLAGAHEQFVHSEWSPFRALAIGAAWVGQFAAAVLLIREGARSHAAAWVNVGYLLLLAGILTRYFDFFSDFLKGGLGLIATGVLILFILYVLNRRRRRTLAGARQEPA